MSTTKKATTATADRYRAAGMKPPRDIDPPVIERKVPAFTDQAPVRIPDGDPSTAWTVAELEAYATREAIDLTDAKNKSDRVAAIESARAAVQTATSEAAAVSIQQDPVGDVPADTTTQKEG